MKLYCQKKSPRLCEASRTKPSDCNNEQFGIGIFEDCSNFNERGIGTIGKAMRPSNVGLEWKCGVCPANIRARIPIHLPGFAIPLRAAREH